jgi:hypothetical protein
MEKKAVQNNLVIITHIFSQKLISKLILKHSIRAVYYINNPITIYKCNLIFCILEGYKAILCGSDYVRVTLHFFVYKKNKLAIFVCIHKTGFLKAYIIQDKKSNTKRLDGKVGKAIWMQHIFFFSRVRVSDTSCLFYVFPIFFFSFY